MALHCRPQLWVIRHSRDKTFHLFLLGTSCNSLIQIWMSQQRKISIPNPPDTYSRIHDNRHIHTYIYTKEAFCLFFSPTNKTFFFSTPHFMHVTVTTYFFTKCFTNLFFLHQFVLDFIPFSSRLHHQFHIYRAQN